MSIHQTAIIDRKAEIDGSAEIGPYVVIEGKVSIGPRTRVMAGAFIAGTTEIGPECVIHPHAVLGHEPQDLSWPGGESFLRVGKGNVLREGCSIHRGSKPGLATVVGDRNFIMGHSHIAHDCVVGSEVILANGALLAGHVHVEDKAFISGNVTVHQFVRIGTLAMVGGLSRVTKDVPPFLLLEGNSTIRAINVVGLRRAGFSSQQREQVKRAYKLLYHSGLNVTQALAAIEKEDLGPEVASMIAFIRDSQRGICGHARRAFGTPEN